MDETPEQWFVREILPHEAALIRYLARLWPRRSEVPDLRHDTYVRVLEAARKVRPTAPKSFLFAIARNLIVDRIRRERVVSIQTRGDFASLNVPVEQLSPEQRVSAHQELHRLGEAFERLPPKCRAVMWLRRVKDLSQKEVAASLGITEKAVSKHISRGVRLLAEALADQGGADRLAAIDATEEEEEEAEEPRHG